MKRIHLDLKKQTDQSYEIMIEKGLFKKIASDLRMKRFAENYVIISDSRVSRIYASKLAAALKREKMFLGKINFPVGEKSKTMTELQKILEKMVGLGANRETGVIALGGGVTGDLGGFVAASFMRGVPYIQIPTSLIAMVDSSVGGKVAVDLEAGKNLAGAFWQPKKVYIDPEMLITLPHKHWKSGFAEAVKYGAIKERPLWEFFEKHIDVWNKETKKLLPSDWNVVEEMIERCVQVKANVVMKDEREGNLRQILNYGHTFAHVIEKMSDYRVSHGEAVATGMRIAGELGVKLRSMPQAELDKQNELLNQLGLTKKKTKGLIKKFVQEMARDKKASSKGGSSSVGKGNIRVVLVDRLGRCHQEMGKYGIRVDPKVIAEVLRDGKWVDDVEPVKVAPSTSYSYSSPSYSSGPSYSSPSSSYSSSSSSYSPGLDEGETDLQKRLREMRERAEQRRREQGGSGGLSGGGFLPG